MDTITRNVRDIGNADRRALEHVIGRQLGDDQRLVIRVVNVDMAPVAPNRTEGAMDALPEWCSVYDGLSADAVASLENTILTRADLSRTGE
jgi:hypothetical protein